MAQLEAVFSLYYVMRAEVGHKIKLMALLGHMFVFILLLKRA